MSANLTTHYVQQFSGNIQLLLQQRGSKLADKVTIGSYVGKQASPVDQIGAVEAQKVTSRFAPMGRVDAPTDRRWVFPIDYDLPQLIDTFDKLRLLADPMSAYSINAAYAMGRAKDDEIISAFFGDAKTGEAGGTTTSFPSAQQVAVNYSGSNDGLTVAKLIKAKELLMAAEVDLDTEQLFVAITSKQNTNLLNETKATNLDYTTRPVLVDGKITAFMGFNFVHVERLKTDSNSYRRVPAWAKSGMHLGVWNEIENSVTQRNDLQGMPWQAYTLGTFGATRLEENKTVEIKCAE